MGVYLCFQTILVIANIAIQVAGRVYIHNNHFLGCAEKGWKWLYTTKPGEWFITAHMILVMMQAVMLEKALYKVPKKMGWFNNTEEELQLA